ncbi:ADP-glyceromanno-heptose 6-epimerase precursor [Mariniphaga anaerophila]|uniref:ADP-L-glycero-D-manno-heptose-6-epimerase n=1 Tax=Mariniphaga anaerophila TaxID=1484053 RepID=A0A1M5A4H6_9BACT|nr:ADP-glyceromanno-heptose 6-epimerase [Mariniphaga anaerophila]SHF24997.1 ADP-glyceromanno-heptose 6-epimerase precursor [Mariniphaga anaerophila]
MIVITGAAGFIGSYLVGKLNQAGYKDLVLIDRFDDPSKDINLFNKEYKKFIDRDKFFKWLIKNSDDVDFIFHMGARTDTVGIEPELYQQLNLIYTQRLWNICTEIQVPLLYASSAATYGNGESGFSDSHLNLSHLRPLNLYGWSKHNFDVWALKQPHKPPFWAGLKFFNVYGPNEYHKGRMASVVLHAYNTIKKTGQMKLFKSHHKDYKDGEQSRDFVFVDDITDVMLYFMHNQDNPGIYNVGTGKARSFFDLTQAVFSSLNIDPQISFIDTPVELRGRYQYFTEAETDKLRAVGYTRPFVELEEGIDTYVGKYLVKESCY